MPEIVGCYHVAGNFDYLLKIVTTDIKSYQSFLKNKLSVIEAVAHVQSNFVMSEVKEDSNLAII
jgi:DNA-binding Lrp family transcriptional regulator